MHPIILAIAITCATTVIADQTVAYTTLSDTGGFSTSSFWAISDPDAPSGPGAAMELAVPFTVSAGGPLVSIDLAIARSVFSASSTTPRRITLAADAGDKPGMVLESWSLVADTSPAIVNLGSTNRPALSVGAKYWLTAGINPKGASTENWYLNSLGLSGTMLYRRSLTTALAPKRNLLPAFRVKVGEATPPPPPPPVPDDEWKQLEAALSKAMEIVRSL